MTSTRDCEGTSAGNTGVMPKLAVSLDTKGRVRVTKEQRRNILAEFARSGESVPKFARRAGLKYSTFAAWVARDRRGKGLKRKPPVRLLEAVVACAPSTTAVLVHLPGGGRLELREAAQVPLVVALVRAMEKPC